MKKQAEPKTEKPVVRPAANVVVRPVAQPIYEDGYREVGEAFPVSPSRREALGNLVEEVK